MNKHGVSRKWFIEAGVKDFKSAALRTTTGITKTGFKLSVSPLGNAIYFSIIMIPKKSYLNYFCDTKPCAKHKKT